MCKYIYIYSIYTTVLIINHHFSIYIYNCLEWFLCLLEIFAQLLLFLFSFRSFLVDRFEQVLHLEFGSTDFYKVSIYICILTTLTPFEIDIIVVALLKFFYLNSSV